MVADGGYIVAGGVHHGHGVGALVDADIDGALAVVAGIHQDDVGAPGLELGLQRSHLGVFGDVAVHVVGVQDDGVAGQILLHRVCPSRGHHQRQRHDYGQKQC